MSPQCRMILRYLHHHGSITPLQALRVCKSFRLSARILELRQAGHKITTRRAKGRAPYAVIGTFAMGRILRSYITY